MFSLANHGGFVQGTHDPALLISEVHPNAASDGPAAEMHEWVEIHNPESYRVSLKGWTLEDVQAIAPLPDVVLEPGETVVVVGSSSRLPVPAGRTLVILETARIGSGLRNAGDRVALVDPYGVRHDAVSWGDIRWPRSSEPPEPHQSIVRTRLGGQTLTDKLTPWTVEEAVAQPDRHQHARPETAVQIVSALVDPSDDDSESITIRNVSDKPVLTVNWSLTVGTSLTTLRSVRINPGESFTITERDGEIGSGLAASGGHLVLRDPRGNWLATASWGNDETFHRMRPPSQGEEIHFSPFARVHPRIAWFDLHNPWHWKRTLVATTSDRQPVLDSARYPRLGAGMTNGSGVAVLNISATTFRVRADQVMQQDSPDRETDRGVWISEVYPTAGQGRNDPAYEWFELTNSTNSAFSLDGWSIADNIAADSLDGVSIPASTSLALGTSMSGPFDVVVAIADGRIGNGLANAGDQLRLIDPTGATVSAISWGDDRTFHTVKSPSADESIHLANPDAAPTLGPPSPGQLPSSATKPQLEESDNLPQDETSTPTSTPIRDTEIEPTSATPRAEPAPAPTPPLVITEILPAPLAGQPEWVEIHNPTDRTVDLAGWEIGDQGGRTPLLGMIPPQGHFVISTAALDSGTPGLEVSRIGNGLNNDRDTVSLVGPDGSVVDYVSYGGGELPAPETGLSIARVPARWVVASESTPGSADVAPLLAEALRTAAVKQPISDQGRLPIVESTASEGSDAWMIVSFALIGVILTLVIRRWSPQDSDEEDVEGSVTYSGPPDDTSGLETADDIDLPGPR